MIHPSMLRMWGELWLVHSMWVLILPCRQKTFMGIGFLLFAYGKYIKFKVRLLLLDIHKSLNERLYNGSWKFETYEILNYVNLNILSHGTKLNAMYLFILLGSQSTLIVFGHAWIFMWSVSGFLWTNQINVYITHNFWLQSRFYLIVFVTTGRIIYW